MDNLRHRDRKRIVIYTALLCSSLIAAFALPPLIFNTKRPPTYQEKAFHNFRSATWGQTLTGGDLTTKPPGQLAKGEHNLILFISNQSSDDPKIDIVIRIDGVEIINDTFVVANSHTWIPYYLKLSEEKHRIDAMYKPGTALYSWDVEVTQKGDRSIIIEYRDYSIGVNIIDGPFGFL